MHARSCRRWSTGDCIAHAPGRRTRSSVCRRPDAGDGAMPGIVFSASAPTCLPNASSIHVEVDRAGSIRLHRRFCPAERRSLFLVSTICAFRWGLSRRAIKQRGDWTVEAAPAPGAAHGV